MTDTSHVALQCIPAPNVPPPAGHYSHTVKAGNWFFVSGVLRLTVTPQAEAALNLCRLISATADGDRPQGAQWTAYIVGIGRWPEFIRFYAQYLQDPKPAQGVVAVPVLHHDNLIEIQLTAVCASPQSPPLAERHRES